MVIALTKNSFIPYIFKRERELPKEERTVIKIKPLTRADMTELMTLFGSGEESVRKLGFEQLVEWLVKYIIGWDNFNDEAGNPVEFLKDSDGKSLKENFDYFVAGDLLELLTAILEINKIGTAEEKK